MPLFFFWGVEGSREAQGKPKPLSGIPQQMDRLSEAQKLPSLRSWKLTIGGFLELCVVYGEALCPLPLVAKPAIRFLSFVAI